MQTFVEIDPEEIPLNPFRAIGKEWMLITAGPIERFNTMTASWGALGVLWGRHVAFCFVRPERHTYSFITREQCFSLSFFDSEHRSILEFCGSHSGRDVDKVARCNLHPVKLGEAVSFDEARLVLVCRTIYRADFTPARFLDHEIEHSVYGGGGYHREFIGELVRAYKRES